MRLDGRKLTQIRNVKITPNVLVFAEGSAMIEVGNTRVLCTASVEPGVPKWLQGTSKGWVTAEYGMLPRSTGTRMKREKIMTGGRTLEISRLIGRSLRSVVDMSLLGENQITVDCDVIQADGGTRTASITGGFVALVLAFQKLKDLGKISQLPLKDYVAAISVGIQTNQALLDLNYEEDAAADTDMNFVMNSKGEFIEVQGTAENTAFTQIQLQNMIELARLGCRNLFDAQKQVVGHLFPPPHSF
jgi:ribonuclease PH